MSKKHKRAKKGVTKVMDMTLKDNEIGIYGSANGWIKIIDGAIEEVYHPVGHTEKDTPESFYFLGKYEIQKMKQIIYEGGIQ